jgi:hypothetical protein
VQADLSSTVIGVGSRGSAGTGEVEDTEPRIDAACGRWFAG